jgi:hypothetical protein
VPFTFTTWIRAKRGNSKGAMAILPTSFARWRARFFFSSQVPVSMRRRLLRIHHRFCSYRRVVAKSKIISSKCVNCICTCPFGHATSYCGLQETNKSIWNWSRIIITRLEVSFNTHWRHIHTFWRMSERLWTFGATHQGRFTIAIYYYSYGR